MRLVVNEPLRFEVHRSALVDLCRNRANQVRVFLNTCRHRGTLVCREREGNWIQWDKLAGSAG